MKNKAIWKIFFRKKREEIWEGTKTTSRFSAFAAMVIGAVMSICFFIGFTLNYFDAPVPSRTDGTVIDVNNLWEHSMNTGMIYGFGTFFGGMFLTLIIRGVINFIKWLRENWEDSVIENSRNNR